MARQRRRRFALGGAAALAVLVGLGVALVSAGGPGLVRALLEARLHRSVSFARMDVSRGPGGLHLAFTDLRIGQPARFGPGDLVRAPRLELTLKPLALLAGRLDAPEVVVTAPELHLRRHGHGDDNWSFGHGGGASSVLGGTRRLEIRDGRVWLDDPQRQLTLQAAVSNAPSDPDLPLRLEGGGVLKGQPYRVVARGGPLNGRRRGEPHRLDVTLLDGATTVRMRGASRAPFDFAGLDVDIAANGPNLADLVYLFNLLAPNSPPFRLTAHMHRADRVFEASRIRAQLGDSDVEGDVRAEHQARRVITAVLRSRTLTAHDLRVLLASPPPHATARSTPGVSGKGITPAGRVFSRTPVSLRRLNGVDATLDYATATASGFGAPVSDARLKLKLADGRVSFAPLAFAAAGGTIRADYALDTAPSPATASLNIRARGLHVSQLKDGFSGALDADLDLRGAGDSVAQQAAHAVGHASLRVHGGALPQRDAAALGGDVFGLLASALQPSARTPLRCLAADFEFRSGVAEATRLSVSTAEGAATGGGRIDLAREQLGLTLQAAPGGHALQLRAPVTLTGPLSRPKVSAHMSEARPGLGGVFSGVTRTVRRVFGGAPAPGPAAQPC